MMTEKQIRSWIPKLIQYERDYTAWVESGERVTRAFKDLVSDLMEAEAEDGDQERIISIYKSEGYAMSEKLYRDINDAFLAAGIFKNTKATQGRKKAVRKLVSGWKGYGKTKVQQVNKVQEEVDKGRKIAAKKLLLTDIIKRHWQPIGQILRDNYDVLTWTDIYNSLQQYEQQWHVQFDKYVEADKAEDAKQAQGK